MFNILITHGYADSNKGDLAILEGIIETVRKILPEAAISVCSDFSEKDKIFQWEHRFTRRLGVEVVGSLLPNPRVSFATRNLLMRIINFLRAFFLLLRSFLEIFLLILPFRTLSHRFMRVFWGEKLLRTFQKADLVLVKGGAFFHCEGSIRGLFHLWRVLYPIIASIFLRKPVIVAPNSFGPFKGILGKSMVRNILNKTHCIMCRESISLKKLRELGVNKNSLILVPDAAFVLKSRRTERVRNILNSVVLTQSKKTVGITVRPIPFVSSDIHFNYIQSFTDFSKHLIHNLNYRVLFLPQVIGPDSRENDLVAVDDILASLGESEDITVLRDDLSPRELMEVYSHMDYIVGTRMHSVIFATLVGVPSLAIAYWGPKHPGIMKMLGMEEFLLDIYSLSVDKLKTSFDVLIEKNEKIREILSMTVPFLRENVLDKFKCSLEGIGSKG